MLRHKPHDCKSYVTEPFTRDCCPPAFLVIPFSNVKYLTSHIPVIHTGYLFFDAFIELYQKSVSEALIQNKHQRLKTACRSLPTQVPSYLSDLFH